MCERTLFLGKLCGMDDDVPERCEGERGDRRRAAWAALLRAHAALVPVIAREVEEATGLPLSWYDVLLELEGGPLRMQELGERVVLSRSRVSRVVDAMVGAGLVTKAPDPADGRATLAAPTRAGRRAQRRAAPAYLAAIDRHFATHLTATERAAIAVGLARATAAVS